MNTYEVRYEWKCNVDPRLRPRHVEQSTRLLEAGSARHKMPRGPCDAYESLATL